MIEDPSRCYQAAQSKDARFDGQFFCAVTSTGIYCRPSCPARTPKRENMRFYATAAGAQQAGFRACLRCRPDATPGSPEWNIRADVVARAMRLIRDGVVDREGVEGLADRLAYSTRQLNRLLTAEVGTGPLALARAQRSQTARVLLETTDLPVTHVAFAAGFASVRQCNDTIRQTFADTPSGLRARGGAHGGRPPRQAGSRHPGHPPPAPLPTALQPNVGARLPRAARPARRRDARRCDCVLHPQPAPPPRARHRHPAGAGDRKRRRPRLCGGRAGPVGPARPADRSGPLPPVARPRRRSRRHLGGPAQDPLVGSLVRRDPGRRVPGAADGFELAVRAVIGQQVSVPGARTVAGRLVLAAGELLPAPMGAVTHLFPTPAALVELAESDPGAFSMPAGRRRALVALARAVETGDVVIDPGADPAELRRSLIALPGIGPWTAEYVAMRALRDPDAFMPTDLGIRRGAVALGLPDDPAHLRAMTEHWRPWRSYAMAHLWAIPAAATPRISMKGRAA